MVAILGRGVYKYAWTFLLMGLAVSVAEQDAQAADSVGLSRRIDAAIRGGHRGELAATASDAEFMRRVYLDLGGVIPTSAEVRDFLADRAGDKRANLVDRLLASPDFARRMEQSISVMLLERRSGSVVTREDWQQYLRDSFANNKPWDQLAGELIGADGTDPSTRPAMNFFLARSATNHQMLARDVSRLFLGRNLECAQCHDHPTIDQYKQADFFGLLAFLNRSYLHKDKKSNQSFFTEKGIGEPVSFSSVFTGTTAMTGPRLLLMAQIKVPMFAKGEELAQVAAEGKPPIPKFPLRPKLAAAMIAPDNDAFRKNIANRLWAMMMGRGLVQPLDMHHSQNPASHPELLGNLAGDFAAMKFDVKVFLRGLALSETYQRSSLLPEGAADVSSDRFAAANAKPLSAEQMTWSVLRATGNLQRVLKVPADLKATAKYRPEKGYAIPAENLDNVLKLFRSVYAGLPGQAEEGFSPSLAAALFVSNEQVLLQWLTPRDGNLMDRLLKLKDSAAIADELYLSVLSRLPDEKDRLEVAEYLKNNPDGREAALREMAWALLASTEFRLNH